MLTLLALLAGLLTLGSAGPLPPSFTQHLAEARPVVDSHLVGLEWPCGGKYHDEACWAGYSHSQGHLATGP